MTHDYTDKSRGIRLQKALAEAGVASRRDCEVLIEAGRVRVNGQVVDTLPAWVDAAQDRLELDGEVVSKPRSATSGKKTAGKHYVMLHKPRNVVSTVSDEPGKDRRTVVDLVELPGRPRLYPVGRLDADSTGMILLTDDGDLTQRLTHPRYGVTKRYLVSIKGRLGEEDLKKLRKGLVLADRKRLRQASRKSLKPDAATPLQPGKENGKPAGSAKGKRASVEQVRIIRHETDRTRGDRTTLGIELNEGQNREIRRMLARLGFKVRKLKRTGVGPVHLKGLAPGTWRLLTTREVQALRRATKMN